MPTQVLEEIKTRSLTAAEQRTTAVLAAPGVSIARDVRLDKPTFVDDVW